ncbi:MAG: MioC protein [Moritella sp.]|jgi:MioC protein
MYKFEIIVGTTLGAAEDAADHLADKLIEDGFQARIHLDPKLEDLPVTKDSVWIVCTATHGAGDYPENIAPLALQLRNIAPNLASIKYSVVALGSKSYDQFCNAGRMIDRQLQQLNAEKVAKTLEICTLETPAPEEAIDEWFIKWRNNWS